MAGYTQWQVVDGKFIGNKGRRRVSTIGVTFEMMNDTLNDAQQMET